MCFTSVSVHSRARMHLIRMAERLGASSRRPRHPFPAVMAGATLAKSTATSQLTSQHEHRTSTTVDELRKVIDHTAPVVAHNGHAQLGHRQYQPCTCHGQAHHCLSGHTGHDAELHGPAKEEESTARGVMSPANQPP